MPKTAQNAYRIIFFDLENSPVVSYNWGIYEQNAVGVVRDWYLMSFSYCTLTGRPVTYTLNDFPLYKRDPHNDRDLCRKLWEVFNEADMIIAHNGDKHDIRKSNARFIKHGLRPPAPYKTVDTLKVARKHFAFSQNKLDSLAQYLGVGAKVKTGGFDLWLECMAGNERAWEKMRRYNANDVVILRSVYNALRGWHNTHPNITLKKDNPHMCPACGYDSVQKRGWEHLRSFSVQRYHCSNCGKWSRGERKKRKTTALS